MHSISPRGAGLALLFGVALVGGRLAPALAHPILAEERWVTAQRETALYSSPGGSTVLGLVPMGTSYRVDTAVPTKDGRLWAWSPYTEGYGWLPAPAVGAGRAPTGTELADFWARAAADTERQQRLALRALAPRDYLYARYPDLAPWLDCIAHYESGWSNVPNARSSGAFGPFQFLRRTFFSTPTGAGGGDWRDPYDQVDAAAEMLRQGRAREWQVVQRRLC